MRVAVLGCGPAGLMAAHGVTMAHYDLDLNPPALYVFSRKRKSPMYGAQYLHAPIPGMTVELPRMITYMLQGSHDDYRRKVYGQMWDGKVSPEDLAVPHYGWDIRDTYNRLWKTYEDIITDVELEPVGLRNLTDGSPFDLLINTVPRNMLCFKGHHFAAIEVIAAGDAPDLGIDIGSQFHCPDETVVCNGEAVPRWYRMSRIFGHTTVEWPRDTKVPITSASTVQKPLFHDCDCWPQITHVGRYGTWEKGVLSHEAYHAAYKLAREWMHAPRT